MLDNHLRGILKAFGRKIGKVDQGRFESRVRDLVDGDELPNRWSVTGQVLGQPGIVLMLKAAAGGAPVTVVAPDPGPAIRLRFLEAGIDLVELWAALKPAEQSVDRLDLVMLEPKVNGPHDEVELVVRKGAARPRRGAPENQEAVRAPIR